jgi:hypothetical protein
LVFGSLYDTRGIPLLTAVDHCIRLKENPLILPISRLITNLNLKFGATLHQGGGLYVGLSALNLWIQYHQIPDNPERFAYFGEDPLLTGESVEAQARSLITFTWILLLCSYFVDIMSSRQVSWGSLMFFFLRCRHVMTGEALFLLFINAFQHLLYYESPFATPAVSPFHHAKNTAWLSLGFLSSLHSHLCWITRNLSTYPTWEFSLFWLVLEAPIWYPLQAFFGLVFDSRWLVFSLHVIWKAVMLVRYYRNPFTVLHANQITELVDLWVDRVPGNRGGQNSGFGRITEPEVDHGDAGFVLRRVDNPEVVPVESKWISMEEYEQEGQVETERELKLLTAHYERNRHLWPDRNDWRDGFSELRQKFGEISQVRISLDQAVATNAMCVICVSEQRELMCKPCNHLCLCRGCARDMNQRNFTSCPICRKNVTSLEVVYT